MRTLALLLIALVEIGGGCAEPGQAGTYTLELYDQSVTCTTDSGRCRDDSGAVATGEQLAGAAWGSWLLSRHQPGGFYLYLELQRADGAVALLEMDVRPGPTDGVRPHVAYREVLHGQPVFVATRVQGVIELPPGRDCKCQDGRFELRLTDAGPDGKLDSADDRVRHLSRAQYSRIAGFCRQSQRTPPPGGLEVVALPCPSWAVRGGEVYVGETEGDVEYVDYGWGCTPVEEDEYVELGSAQEEEDEVVWEEEDEGCGSDPGEGRDDDDAPGACAVEDDPEESEPNNPSEPDQAWESDSSSSGCVEDDDSYESDSSSSSGCSDGDSSSSSSSSSSDSASCEGSSDSSSSSSSSSSSCGGGDSSSSSSSSSSGPSCEGDAMAATGPPPPPRAARKQRARRPWWRRGLSLKLVLLGVVLAALRRAARRRRRRPRPLT